MATALIAASPLALHTDSSCRRRRNVSCGAASTISKSRTQKIMESLPAAGDESGGAGGASSYQALKRLDELWLRLRSTSTPVPVPEIVKRHRNQTPLNRKQSAVVVDLVVCGGTLGIFFAAALALRGLKVAIVEKSLLKGREQEWNISRNELQELIDAGLITEVDAESIISIAFNPNRAAFDGGSEVWVKDVLNLGISPARLIETLKKKFLDSNGMVIEGAGVSKIDVFDDAAITTLDDGTVLVSRLVLDAMGNFSPVVRQIRKGKRPDGICLVVGSCARGFDNNSTSDVIYTNSPITSIGSSKTQYFWEAFPAGSGPKDRTTYLFSYMDATPNRPSLEELLDDYWDRMPDYQGVKLEDLQVLRVLFGIFPTYRSSPLPAGFDRILQVGDASGIQSPVSFGGFGSITRHIRRISSGILEALDADTLDKSNLSLLNPYMPNLSGAWLFQKAMSVQTTGDVSSTFINELLDITFKCMERLGDPVLRPFLQDVIQFVPLAQTMGSIMITKPSILPQIFSHVGLASIGDWLIHFLSLGLYTLLCSLFTSPTSSLTRVLPPQQKYVVKRTLEAWEYGAGLDYTIANRKIKNSKT